MPKTTCKVEARKRENSHFDIWHVTTKPGVYRCISHEKLRFGTFEFINGAICVQYNPEDPEDIMLITHPQDFDTDVFFKVDEVMTLTTLNI